MIFLGRPDPFSIRSFLFDQASKPFSYPEVGATNGELPAGYWVNHTRKYLGQGQPTFDFACEALQSWQQLQLGWVDCWPHDTPLKAGEHVAVIGRAFGLWWLNACRVAYTIHDREPKARFGYAHGTLPAHLAIGEERFLVEMTPDKDVWIDILAFSRPNTLLARIGYPLMRHAQRRFGNESADRILSAVRHLNNMRT
jgi:uncharacterized protein (UPF0548 family)